MQESSSWFLVRSIAKNKLSSWQIGGRLLMGPEWRNTYVERDAQGNYHEAVIVLRDAIHLLAMLRLRASYEART